MQALKHYGRRRLDRQLLVGAIVVLFAGLFVYQVACGSKNTVGPSDVPAYTPPTPTGSVGTPQTVTPDPTPEPGPGGNPFYGHVNANGSGWVQNKSGSPKTAYVTITAPLNLSIIYAKFEIPVPADGEVHHFDSACSHLECFEKTVQVDINQDGYLAGFHVAGRADVKCNTKTAECEECQPHEPEIIDTSDPYKGDPVECPVSDQDGCFECFAALVDVTWSDGCVERKETRVTDRILREQVECQCEPGEWQDISVSDPQKGDNQVECPATDEEGCFECFDSFVVVTQTNGCDEREIRRATDRMYREQVECPEPGLCYYRVSCGEQGFVTASNGRECDDHAQQTICEAAVGLAGDSGIWRNFGDAQLLNHCQFNEPGYINADFQLNPGQSDPDCLNKNDDD